MKKSFRLFCAFISILSFFTFSCQHELLPSPKNETTTDQNQNQETIIGTVPENLVATHGLKGKIELSWQGVQDTARYNIYEAATPYDKFIQIAETTTNTTSYTLEEKSGASKYYKVTAVNRNGKESPFSIVAHGTTLAIPVITYIGQDEQNSDSACSVHWYMNNCNSATYQQNVRYTINCFDPQGNNVAEKVHDGNADYPSITFEDLIPNTNYTYQITAYIVTHQNDTEVSDKADAATARRLRPNAPENLSATLGTSTTENTITFDLPAMVDVALGNGIYEPKPLYFKIYRKLAADEDTAENWKIIESKFDQTIFGTQYTPSNSDQIYEPGQTVTYVDTKDLKRGIMYDYKVQSYADETNREISSNLSIATTKGFLMAVPKFEITNIVYTDNELTGTDRQYVKIQANHILTWDNLGKEIDYDFILVQKKSLLEGDGGDGTIVDVQQLTYSTMQELNEAELVFDLSSTPENVRGYYKYTLYIVSKGETDINNAVTSTAAIGQLLVTNDVDTPKVKFFSVSNNYKDKIIVEWDYNPVYRYQLVYVEDGTSEEIPLTQEEMDILLQDKAEGDTITFVHPTASGIKRGYKIYPTSSQTETNLPVIEGQTLTTPLITNEELFHEKIELSWNEIQADTFNISAKYQDSAINNENKIEDVIINVEELKTNSENPFEYTFTNPTGFDNIHAAGLPIDITLKANKQVTKNVLTLVNPEAESINEMYHQSVENIKNEDTNVIETTENSITTRLVGPALVNAQGIESNYTNNLSLTWNKIEGATAYAIIRTQYIYNKNHNEEYKTTQKYIVTDIDGKISVASLGILDEEGIIPKNVNISLTDNKFTLIDNDINNADKTNAWQISQSQISWGCPYEYVVIPLVSDSEEPEFEANDSRPTSFLLPSISVTYENLPYTRSSTIGYAWNITASKGWQTQELLNTNSTTNNSIYITWKKPVSNLKPEYNIYRREERKPNEDKEDRHNWKLIKEKESEMSYIDTNVTPGVVYEYQVGLHTIVGETNPCSDTEYVEYSDLNKDTKYTEEKSACGFILPKPLMKSASRDARPGNTELITWFSAKVGDINNRMIDGYAIEVYNNNIGDSWNEIAKFEIGSDLDKSLYEFAKEVDNTSGLLKVLRDYKHYFRVRAFTKQDGKYCYSPEPLILYDYNYEEDGETKTKQVPITFLEGEDDYVKWGCRQITAQEFCKMANLVITYGLRLVNGDRWSWTSTLFESSKNASEPGSGKVSTKSNAGVSKWTIKYQNYKPALNSKAGQIFANIIINGTLKPNTKLTSEYPRSYDSDEITINVPETLYNGSITYSGLTKSSGSMQVTYNGTTTYLGYSGNSPLPFHNDDYHHEDDSWY